MLCMGLCVTVWRGLTMSEFGFRSLAETGGGTTANDDRFVYAVNRTGCYSFFTSCSASDLSQVVFAHLRHFLFCYQRVREHSTARSGPCTRSVCVIAVREKSVPNVTGEMRSLWTLLVLWYTELQCWILFALKRLFEPWR